MSVRSSRSLSERRSKPRFRTPFRAFFTGVTVAGLTTTLLVASLLGAGSALVHVQPAAADEEPTSSAVTVTNERDHLKDVDPADAPFPKLEVTVSQTKDLVSQGIEVSWTGGERSNPPVGGNGGSNFLQIAQCWGEDKDNPGHPDRRTCQYGGTLGFGSQRDGFTLPDYVSDRDDDFTAFGPAAYTAVPFVAYNDQNLVDEQLAPAGSVITNLKRNDAGVLIQKPNSEAVDVNTNAFFTGYTTNEIPWAPTSADGKGTVSFEVQTAMQSSGLGCGIALTEGSGVTGKSCWLVMIPRGTADSGETSISQSGLWWDAWEHHLAVKLEFKPLGVRCELGQAEKQIAGSELISQAIASWQPKLCGGDDGAPFVLRTGNEADDLVKAAGTNPSPLAFTTRPLNPDVIGAATDPLAYAPVAIGGVTISFAIDREPKSSAPAELQARARLPFTELKLTPRLLAKLLTASYRDALPSGADKSHIGYVDAAQPGKNPRTIVQDPEFIEINGEEWAAQGLVGASIGDALLPSGRSDLAYGVWQYIVADPDARKWIDGEPDPWGMVVNPWYSTNAEKNPSGVALDLPTDSFPKADPIEKRDDTATGGSGAVNLVTWRPFASGFEDGAYQVLRGNGMTLGAWDSTTSRFTKPGRQLLGSRKLMALATTPAAERFQTITALLRNPAGEFVAPTREGLSAAAAAMIPTGNTAVRQFDQTSPAAKAAAAAYPLTVPVYAALNPQQTDPETRAAYAGLIRYAAGPGQSPGTDDGELPPGYAALPQSWVDQSLLAAAAIEQGGGLPSTPPTNGGTNGPMNESRAAPTTNSTSIVAPSGQSGPGATTPADPTATGDAAGSLAGYATPDDPAMSAIAAAVPIGIVVGLAAALAVPMLGRLRRRV